jgi:hypothetical protein
MGNREDFVFCKGIPLGSGNWDLSESLRHNDTVRIRTQTNGLGLLVDGALRLRAQGDYADFVIQKAGGSSGPVIQYSDPFMLVYGRLLLRAYNTGGNDWVLLFDPLDDLPYEFKFAEAV